MESLKLENKLVEAFVVIAETGSLQRAAVKLKKSKSTMSRWLAEFEDILGYSVFHRESSGLKLVLNESGKSILSRAKLTLETSTKFEKFALSLKSNATPNQLTLCFNQLVTNDCIIGLVSSMKERFPHIELLIERSSTNDVEQHFNNHQVDFFLGFSSDKLYSGIGGAIVGEERMMFVTEPNHPLLAKKNIESSTLILETIIMPTFIHSESFQPFDRIFSSDFMMGLDLSAAQLGIAYVTESIAKPHLRSKRVSSLSINWEELTEYFPLMLFYKLDYPYPEIKDALVMELKDWFGN
ncbi:LysR family transcriptional regulator [Vibrio sp. 10N.261.51.F12]|uniref:LysR family transcriptional regulator n=1 Tax=Vibrio sp. 10N.261.51.F12 TaxID=3229679 RepID=UPI00354CE56B